MALRPYTKADEEAVRRELQEHATMTETEVIEDIRNGTRRFVVWDRAIWHRTYRPGGFDGYRTLSGRRLPCDTMEKAVRCPGMADEIRRLSERH